MLVSGYVRRYPIAYVSFVQLLLISQVRSQPLNSTGFDGIARTSTVDRLTFLPQEKAGEEQNH